MAKVVLICGKLCSGKSTYAKQLCLQNKAVLLSVDEIMLPVLGPYLGDRHDAYGERTKKYLYNKSAELIETGISVILDWGFWTGEERAFARAFYKVRNIECEFHYLDICEDTWKARRAKRNRAVSAGEANDYFVDENLAAKFSSRFETPGKDEIEVWVKQ